MLRSLRGHLPSLGLCGRVPGAVHPRIAIEVQPCGLSRLRQCMGGRTHYSRARDAISYSSCRPIHTPGSERCERCTEDRYQSCQAHRRSTRERKTMEGICGQESQRLCHGVHEVPGQHRTYRQGTSGGTRLPESCPSTGPRRRCRRDDNEHHTSYGVRRMDDVMSSAISVEAPPDLDPDTVRLAMQIMEQRRNGAAVPHLVEMGN